MTHRATIIRSVMNGVISNAKQIRPGMSVAEIKTLHQAIDSDLDYIEKLTREEESE